MHLGEKIKNARKQLGLTQEQLASDVITRNMLSKIENNVAKPSFKTLEYLAKSLNLPIGFLCADELDIGVFEKKDGIEEIYKAYSAKKYMSCINRAKRLSAIDNEIAYILADCYYKEGVLSLKRGLLQTAEGLFNLCKSYSKRCVLDTAHITLKLPMYLAMCKNISSPLLEFDPSDVESALLEEADYEYLKYISLDLEYPYKNPTRRNHIEAKKEIKARNYHGALVLLNAALDYVRENDYDAYTVFSIYSDLESCYKQLSDFEKAYTYASKKLSLIEGFKS